MFLLCFTDSVQGSTEQLSSSLDLVLESFKAWPSSAKLNCSSTFTFTTEKKHFLLKRDFYCGAEKSFCRINFTAGFESLPPPRQLNLQKRLQCTQPKVHKYNKINFLQAAIYQEALNMDCNDVLPCNIWS